MSYKFNPAYQCQREKTCVQYDLDPPSYDSLETDTTGLPAYQDVLAGVGTEFNAG